MDIATKNTHWLRFARLFLFTGWEGSIKCRGMAGFSLIAKNSLETILKKP